MARKKRRLTPEERADAERRAQETLSLLQERIDYHRAKLKEERGPDYEPPTLEEHAARLHEESERAGRESASRASLAT